ncbi:hypothetical protein [Bradyrhizobium sp. 2TAF24]|uniref:hypothetical protein n=1 Tax=Bradyrhizobium sp. 2TAF24 TaxID=3233011 RepID=UPI003F92D986
MTKVSELWDQARQIDPTLKMSRKQFAELARRRLMPTRYSRDLVFSAMAAGRPVVVSDLAVPVRGEHELGARTAVFEALRDGFPKSHRFAIRLGRSGQQRVRLRADELMRRWINPRTRVSIPDLHIRGSELYRAIDCTTLSDFNLLAGAPSPIGEEEMLTMVVSSAGIFTDSHSDAPDGSNHCFVGRKLWLVWDTFEGLARNLEDVERSGTDRDQAAFDIAAFLAIPGARWFTVEDGQTLFLPGHLTHKVITLEDYLGVGSFFVMLPSYLRTLLRWSEHTPLWALTLPAARRMELVDQITRRVTRKVNALARQPEAQQIHWGLPHLVAAVAAWQSMAPAKQRALLLDNPASARLLDAVGALQGQVPNPAVRPRASRRALPRDQVLVA